MNRWLFINPELTVHLHREAAGEWICLDAQTAISTGGAGLATSVLSDRDGPVGVGAQSLLIAYHRQAHRDATRTQDHAPAIAAIQPVDVSGSIAAMTQNGCPAGSA